MYIQNTKFFNPDNKMVEWIVDYAAGRTIIEVGCGTGHLAEKLFEAGVKNYIGIDPYMDYTAFMKMRYEYNLNSLHVFPYEVNSKDVNYLLDALLSKNPEKFIIVLARPCHHPALVDGAFELGTSETEHLYIGLPRNYNIDLETEIPRVKKKWKHEELNHLGTSADGEKVLKILIDA